MFAQIAFLAMIYFFRSFLWASAVGCSLVSPGLVLHRRKKFSVFGVELVYAYPALCAKPAKGISHSFDKTFSDF